MLLLWVLLGCSCTLGIQALPCKVHLCVDGWTSPNYMSFLGVTVHWGEGSDLEHVTLDFIK